MLPRERVIKTFNREIPDKMPIDIRLSPYQKEVLYKKTGYKDAADFFDLEMRRVSVPNLIKTGEFSVDESETNNQIRVDEWGIKWQKGSQFHFEKIIHPLNDVSSVQEIEKYPFPKVPVQDAFSNTKKEVKDWQKKGYAVVIPVAPLGGTIFWPAYKLRGMENLLMDFTINPGFAEILFDMCTEISSELVKQIAACKPDIILLADDFGTERNLMFSVEVWKKFFKQRFAKIIEIAKNEFPDILIALHSDGMIENIIPDLIDIGVDILNPVQPECMDPAKIKKEFGNHMSFWGTVGTQTTMPFGTTTEVERIVRERIDTVGKNGGLLISPTHVIEPEVPWENIIAFVDTARKYGIY